MNRKPTGNQARLVGHINRSQVRWADSGDHWPGYDDAITLRRGYWVGNDRLHGWIGLRKLDVEAEASERGDSEFRPI